jgi:hypothetical protein
VSAMAIRSITLSEESSQAWKAAGCYFPRRERTMQQMLDLYVRNESDFIINLGHTAFNPSDEDLNRRGIIPDNLFNIGRNIRPLVRPGTTRELLGDLLPPYPVESDVFAIDYWVKAPGAKGKGKVLTRGHELPKIPKEWDLQVHIKGQEYRVITVDDTVVQVNERHGDNGDRSYEWVGVTAAPRAVKQVAKDAARKLEGRNVIGWDIILENDKAYVLEGNSCPGMNDATAKRILDWMRGRSYEDAGTTDTSS